MSTADLLAQGIAAARAGRKDEARATLLKVLEVDDRSEPAWLWLSGLFETPAERRVCLENVLEINPANAHARRGLELLACQQPAPTPPPARHGGPVAAAPAPAPQGAATIRLPSAGAPAVAAQAVAAPPAPAPGPATSDTIELPRLPEPAPKQPWWRPRRPASAAPAGTAGQAAAPDPAPAPPPLPPPVTPAPPLAILWEAKIALPAVATDDGDAEEPCPYCGATTLVGQRSCPGCRKSLMVRGRPREQRSVALIILVSLYALSSVGALGGGVMTIVSLVGMAMAASAMGMEVPIAPLVGAGVGVIVAVALCVMMTLGLYRRKTWAYALHCLNLGLSALATLGLIALSALAGASLAAAFGTLEPGGSGEAAGALGAAAGSIGLIVVCNVVVLVGYIALTVLSYRDFYGAMARMSTAGIATEGDAYNAGIAYRNRGMWYMAAHEWELAARAAPRDVTVRRALGLAYAQLGRYDQARDELSVALAMAPGDPQLTQDVSIVERLAAKKA